MPSFKCSCGEIIRFGEIPNKNEYLVISDTFFDSIQGKVDSDYLYSIMKHILECSNCGRWWYFPNGFEEEPVVYRKEG